MYDQEDTQTHYRTDEFIFGEKILVCPINEPHAKGRRMYVPKGKWFNYWTDALVEGQQEHWVDADIDSMPIFVKEGAIIPKYPVQQFVGENEIHEITLDVYFKNGKEKSQLFDDTYDGYDYRNGKFSLRTFKLIGRDNELIIHHHKSGKFVTKYKKFKLRFHGLPFEISKIQIDNKEISFDDVQLNGDGTLVVDKDFGELHLR